MQKKIYYNSNKDIWYLEGDTLTYRVNSYYVFSGIPTEEQLFSWGFEINPGPIPSPTITVDTQLDIHSDNPIANSVVAMALGDIDTILDNILGN